MKSTLFIVCLYCATIIAQDFGVDTNNEYVNALSRPIPRELWFIDYVILTLFGGVMLCIVYITVENTRRRNFLRASTVHPLNLGKSDYVVFYIDAHQTFMYCLILKFTHRTGNKYIISGCGDNVGLFNITGTCNVKSGRISFNQQYDDTSKGKLHYVEHTGTINLRNNLIEGTWCLRNGKITRTGTFKMRQYQ